LDMLPDGSFREPSGPPPIVQAIGRTALVTALVAGGFALAALALWFALTLIPIAIGAGLIAWIAFRIGPPRRARGVPAIHFGWSVGRVRGDPPTR
jgi:hypothetical protein